MARPMAAGVVILSPDRTRVLALRNDHKNPGGYGLPFGKAMFGEAPRVTAGRECYEETNLFANDMEEFYAAETNGHWAIAFFVRAYSGILQPSNEGVPEWVTPSQLVTGIYADYNAGVLARLRERGLLVETSSAAY